MGRLINLLGLPISLLVVSPLTASDRYASDAAALSAAITASTAGDTVIMRNGVWRDVVIAFEGTGTTSAPVTLRAETPGGVVLVGKSRLEIGGEHLVVDGLVFTDGWLPDSDHVIQFRRGSRVATDCRLTNTAIISYNPPDPTLRYFWVSLYGRRNRVDHCYFDGMAHNGVTLVVWRDGSRDEHRVDHNHFAHHASGGGENGWETIRVGTSSDSLSDSATTVEFNFFEECNGEIETISNKSGANLYRANTFLRNQGMLTLRHGDGCRVEGNRFLGENVSNTGGIRVIGRDHVIVNNYIERTRGRDGAAITIYAGQASPELSGYSPADRATVAFNTIVDVTGPAISYAAGLGSTNRSVLPTGVVVANNLLANTSTASGEWLTGASPDRVVFDGNIAFGRSGAALPAAGFRAADPRLARGDDGLYRPAGDSPVVDAASAPPADVPLDFDGTARGNLRDVGADEVTAASSAWPTATASNTGPTWLGAERNFQLGRLVNIATRGLITGETQPMILGFVVQEGTGRTVLVRAVGPTLAGFGVAGVAPTPSVQVLSGQTILASNANWNDALEPAALAAAAVRVGTFALPEGSADSALLMRLEPGAYTAIISDPSGSEGLVLGEVYELR